MEPAEKFSELIKILIQAPVAVIVLYFIFRVMQIMEKLVKAQQEIIKELINKK